MKYIVLDLDRYELKHSDLNIVESDKEDIEEFFKEYIGYSPELEWYREEMGVEVLEDRSILIVDGEEAGFYIKKL